ncbi:MAG: DUF4012 domain-containing protein [Patescibacteria group bacterium]|nr:DUF4012 domain-containing protein [Patescibacteria group bacterium]
MLNEKKLNYLDIEQDDRPSRFMVDLNKIADEQTYAAEKSSKGLRLFWNNVCCVNRYNKKKNINQPDLKSGKNNFFIIKRNQIVSGDFANRIIPRIKQLAFFEIFKIFYKLCYGVGWLAIFITRFFYIISDKGVRVFKKYDHGPPAASSFSIQEKTANFKLINAENSEAAEQQIIREDLKNNFSRIDFADEIYLDDEPIDRYKRKIINKEILSGKQELADNQVNNSEEEPKHNRQHYNNGVLLNLYLRFKPAVSFALVLVIIISPFKAFTAYTSLSDFRGEVLGASEAAISDFKNASGLAVNSDFSKAQDGFILAGDKFSEAKNKIREISAILNILSPLIPNDDIRLAAQAGYIVEAGRLAADLGNEFAAALGGFAEDKDCGIKEFVDNLYTHVNNASQIIADLNYQINKIDHTSLPKAYQEEFLKLEEMAILLEEGLIETADIVLCSKKILGFEKDSRYLFVFQNNYELRASGGFIGSYALLDFHDGKIKKMEVPGGGSYDTEGGLSERIIAPEPLHLVNPLWHFWDANWWPDWPTSAEKLMWFYEKSGGSTVDGVISLTPTIIERALFVLGSIDMREKYGEIITADNFWEITQKFAEEKPEICTEEQVLGGVAGCISTSSAMKHEPKKIIGDLIDKMLEEFPKRINKDNLTALFSLFENGLKEKHILFYFNDEELDGKSDAFGWSGKIKQTAWDYVMVVNTNIAGEKTDRVVKEEIDHEAEILSDGSIINTLKITRKHQGVRGELFTGVRNVDWLRIYVPLGSELIEASGFSSPDNKLFEPPDDNWQKDPDLLKSENNKAIDFKSGTEIYDEFNKTVFANWAMVDPGESIILSLKYKLPFKLKISEASEIDDSDILRQMFSSKQNKLCPYALMVQKQPGSLGSRINSRLILPDNYKISWKYPSDLNTISNSWYVNDELTVDKFWAVAIE